MGGLSTAISPFSAGLAARCPRCGKGALFQGFLAVRERCPVCGLDLSRHDSGDGPAVFVILILGAVVVALALWVELRWEPPLWVHAALWTPFTLGAALAMLRPLKGVMVAMHYQHRMGEND
ncbi:membrane protein [Allostella vacuolata]|nr:membrane protein [Stella vacuolata]